MAKNKRFKFQRVYQLPNVTLMDQATHARSNGFPWDDERLNKTAIILELGCGKGEHSLAFAMAEPDRFYIGVDRKSHRLCFGAERALSEGIQNVHFIRSEIACIGECFASHSISEIWLTFPDPHPKARAFKNRLTTAFYLELYAKLLIPRGIVHLKTDSPNLYNYTQEAVTQWGGRICAGTQDIHGSSQDTSGAGHIVSAFEEKALEKGRSIHYLAFSL